MHREFYLSYYQKATKDFAISLIREPVEALQPHIHDYYQLYYVANGTLCHHLDKREYVLHPGDAFILPPNIPHHITKESETVAFYVVSFKENFCIGSAPIVTDFLHYLTKETGWNRGVSLKAGDRDQVQNLLGWMVEEFSGEKIGKQELLHQSLDMVLTLFARNDYEAEAKEAIPCLTNRQKVIHSVEYVNSHFAENITLEDMIASTQMSKASFCKLFITLTGMTFNQFLHMRRIEKARQLIFEGYKIAQVSALCGYQDFSTFYRNFKKITGISPTDYRAEEMSHSR